ncbi:hypothetical protein ACWEWI_35415 [Streptomyces sp. NPDC003753]|uniref:hypothetical protein n=1 Tax=unclassified Streptomyces TaxID=2593676 RepID=UPI0019062DB0|nr:hypothetical protein [Streptomyces sp. Y2F8-2]
MPSVLAQHLDEQFVAALATCDCRAKTGVPATKTSIGTIRTRSGSPTACTAAARQLSAAWRASTFAVSSVDVPADNALTQQLTVPDRQSARDVDA